MGGRLDGQLDTNIGLRQRTLGVAAATLDRVLGEPELVERSIEVGVHRQLLVHGRERVQACGRRLGRVGCNGRDRLTGVLDLCAQNRAAGDEAGLRIGIRGLVRPDHGADAVHGAGGLDVEADDPRVGVRRAEHRTVKHPGEGDVDGVPGRTRRAYEPVEARRRSTEGRELLAVGKRLELVLRVDERPRLRVPALHLTPRADEPERHRLPAARRIARSIFG